MPELARATLAVYRFLWEAHAAPRLARLPMREIDARRVVAFRGELLGSKPAAPIVDHLIIRFAS